MDASLIIRLVDQVTAPARGVKKAVQGISKEIGTLKGEFSALKGAFSVEAIEEATQKAEQRFSKARSRLLGAAGMALTLAAPIKQLGDFEERLVLFGNTAGIFGDDLKDVEGKLRDLAPLVNRSAGELLTALEYLVGKGLTPEVALKALESVGMTATATGSDIEDMAAAGFSAMDNLEVAAEDLQAAFDAMAQSGKSGGFELKGMAAYFPGITANARALKMEGVSAVAELTAALQIAMKGAGQESVAANNLQNFLSKLSSREVTKNFAKNFGVDLEAEFQKAADSGVSVFEHMINLIYELTDGNEFKVQELFGDQQVLAFLRPMLANLDEFREIRDAALSADGVNAGDFDRMADTFNAKLKSIAIEIDNIVSKSGALLDVAKDVASQIAVVVGQINAFAEAHPELTKNIVLATAALLTMNIAMRLVSFASAGLNLAFFKLLGAFVKFDGAGKNVAKGWRLMRYAGMALRLVFTGLVAAGSGLLAFLGSITAPVWAIIAALAAAGFAVWKYWDRISSFLEGLFAPFAELGQEAWTAISEAVGKIFDKLMELIGLDPGQARAAIAAFFDFSGAIEGAKEALDGFWAWVGGFFSQEKLSNEEKENVRAAGRAIGDALINGVKAGAEAVWDWFATWPQKIREAIGQIDLGSVFNWGGGQDQGEGGGWFDWFPGIGPAPIEGAAVKQEVETRINAEVVDKRPPNVTVNAPVTVNGAGDPAAAGRAVAEALNREIGQARTGALHGGTEQ